MARTIRQWLQSSGAIRNHPQIVRFLGEGRAALWVPQRRSVALGAGIGAAVSVLPLPAQPVIAGLAAMRFGAHLPTAFLLTFLSNPLTTLPLWGVAWMIGAFCLGQPIAWPDAAAWPGTTEWVAWVQGAGKPLLLGLPLLGIWLGLTTFALAHIGWRLAILRKWHSRPAAGRTEVR
ncbi:DUF2062 domain-containing protein [Noviherbaspirillum sp.]|uniref:DUF2062 domain-containing protein n=1 Tax=Noviherbaspirillum sp. TaxID=1926288 RepID=UPI002FE29ABB